MPSPGPAPDAPLILESDAPGGQAGVAALYGVSVKKVKRWVAAGRATGEPPPLHSPLEMRAWHERLRLLGHFHHAPGPEFDRAASRLSVPASPSPVSLTDSPSSPAAPASAPRIPFRDPSEPQSTDLLTRLETDESRLHRRYNDAIDQCLDDTTIRQYRSHWQEAAELLDRHQGRLQKRVEVLTAAEADTAFTRIVRPLPEALERSFPREPPPAESWTDTVRAAIRMAFSRLPSTLEEMLA